MKHLTNISSFWLFLSLNNEYNPALKNSDVNNSDEKNNSNKFNYLPFFHFFNK